MSGKSSAILAIAFAAMMLIVPGTVAAQDLAEDRVLSVTIETGTTARMGGGDWIAIRAGDISYGVIYGNDDNPNEIILLTDQRRYVGVADVYGENGELLRKQGIPMDLIFAGKIVTIVEFIDLDNDSVFDLRWLNNASGLADKPVKTASLKLPWVLENLQVNEDVGVTTVTFDLTATNVCYTWVWHQQGMMHKADRATPADGVVERITFTMHITIREETRVIEMVPWFNVTVKDGRVANHSFAGYRNYTANVLNGTIKYDQYIEGWDFASDDSKLAVETILVAGLHANGPVAERVRERAYHMHCEMNGTPIANDNGSGPESPVIARDTLRFQNEWENVGSLSWVSDVDVDGQTKQMTFQVQNGGKFEFTSNGHLYLGFLVRAAFVYPAGDVISHDPTIQSTAAVLAVEEATNVFSKLVVFAQLAAVILGMGLAIALGIFLRRQSYRRPPAAAIHREPLYPPIPQQPRQPPAGPPTLPGGGGKEQ
ncbi:MAG: hypothetical protein QXE18_06690 [Thermoplasmata archaeon]